MTISPSSELALTVEYPPAEFSTFHRLAQDVEARYRQLGDDRLENQYLSFNHISPDQFETLERQRLDLLGRGAALIYFTDIETLIIKLPTEVTERAHASLAQRLMAKTIIAMQMGYDEFTPIGATKYNGVNSSKEGDSAFKNLRLRFNKGDWPNFVIEASLSEALPRLRSEARWWMEHSGGEVLMVLLIWVQPRFKTVTIEKWVSDPSSSSSLPPTQMAEVTIDQSGTSSVVVGAPLCLEFERIFGRLSNPPREKDVVFTRDELDDWARLLWIGI